MLLLHISKPSSRARYIFHLIFHDLLGLDYDLVSDTGSFLAFQGPKLTYGSQPLADELFQQSADLLFETATDAREPEVLDKDGSRLIFPVRHPASAFPFDLFSASFYLVTRYEEYATGHRDQHGRFIPGQSIASRLGFLDKPVVNQWALEFGKVLRKRFPELPAPDDKFTFLPTMDIDSAYAYRFKGALRNLGGFVRDITHGNPGEVRKRFSVVSRKERDPFDTYDYMLDLHAKYQLRPVFFILLGNYGPQDKNLSFTNPRFRELIKRLAKEHEVGIHPSYASHASPERLKTEIDRLADITGREITHSRQHFLRFTLPQTFRDLASLGIKHEFSMGYAQEPGFRAGICSPYLFFDLRENRTTHLMIHPFAVMDGTLADYKQYDPSQANAIINDLLREVRAVNGTFISIWHNESLSDQNRWRGWKTVYEYLVKEAISN
jgi:hypothetical protein